MNVHPKQVSLLGQNADMNKASNEHVIYTGLVDGRPALINPSFDKVHKWLSAVAKDYSVHIKYLKYFV